MAYRHPVATQDECIYDLQRVYNELYGDEPHKSVTRDQYRGNGEYTDAVWTHYFGTFTEFAKQAGLKPSRQQDKIDREAGKHASVDHYRAFTEEKRDYGDLYIRENNSRFKTILGIADIHDIQVDPFWLRVVLDTAKRVQPDVICINGDLFDMSEFGRFTIDPREWDIVGRVQFVHDNVLQPLREVCPSAQIDLIEGNHEYRLVKHLADASPAMRSVLADLHGWDIATLLGLKEYQVNYVAEADLAAWTKRDEKKELAKNHKIYYDSMLVHHEPVGKSMGMPGFSGHHHKHALWSFYNPMFGSFEWHQIGSGHRRSATYAEGLFWANGFILCNIDVEARITNFDYIPITNHAVSGGKWYYRQEDENVLPFGRK